MEKPKKVVIKIHESGQIEIIAKDKDVLVVIQTPDGAENEVFEGDKKVWEDGKLEDGGRLDGLI